MKILLHTCCAGCAIYTFGTLEKKFDKVTGFFFNPNIHPAQEFKHRKDSIQKYAKKHNKEIIFEEYDPKAFFHEVNYKEAHGERCPICWRLRLKKTAELAKARGYDSFTTTLLISPYQDHLVIKAICEGLSKEVDIPFYYEDFRVGFKGSQKALETERLYKQKYCGCIYSEMERQKKTKKVKAKVA